MRRTIALAFLGILAISLLQLQLCSCTTKLSTPTFTVTYTDDSYDTTSYPTTNPYTGESIEVPIKHIDDRTLQFKINYKSNTRDSLHFVIQMKGHYSSNWTTVYNGWANSSGPEVTIWSFSTFRGQGISGEQGYFYKGGDSFYVPAEGQLDFQVKAQTWGEVMAETSATNPFGGSITTLFGESDWSSTQTVTIDSNAPTSAPSPTEAVTITPTPTLPSSPTTSSTPDDHDTEPLSSLSWEVTALLAGLVGAVAALGVGMFLLWRRVNSKPVS